MLWSKEHGGYGSCSNLPRRPARKTLPVPHGNRLAASINATRLTVLTGIIPLPYNSPMAQPPRRPNIPAWPASLSPRPNRPPRPRSAEQPDQFRSLNASLLYCPRCQVATPTRERLLLVLPEGNLYEYLCQHCGTSTGSKTDQQQHNVIRP